MSKKYIKAGAGSGKTFKIMEEIVQTLNAPESNVHIQNCIVTTFTEKAAQELKERISAKLLELNMYEELSNLSEAKIGTVHSICADFLKQYGYLINLSPNLDVISQEERNLMLADLIMEEVDADELTELCERFDKIDFKTNQPTYPEDISSIVDLAKANRISAESLKSHSLGKSIEKFKQLQSPTSPLDWEGIGVISQQIIQGLRTVNFGYATNLSALISTFLSESITADGSVKIKWSTINSIANVIVDKPNIKGIYEGIDPNGLFIKFNQWTYFQEDMVHYTNLVYDAAANVFKKYDEKKTALGLMDFNDMESYMLDLLENPTFQEEFSNVIRFVLVDEFQDTNPVQAEIFSKWHEFAGKSFWVGDNKQSIYRFRGADLNFIRSITSTLDGEALDTSYRSRKKIVDLTNQLFQPVFGPDGDYPNNLLVAREEADGHYGEAIRLIDGVKAENIANSVEKMLNQAEHWPVHIKDTGVIRSLKANDIAILLHKNDDVDDVISALVKRNIPVAQFGKFLVQEDEIIFFNSILSFIANPVDNFAISKIAYYQHFDLDAKKWTEHRVAYRNNQMPNVDANLYLEETEEQIIFQANYGSDIDFINQLGAFQKSAKSLSITELIDQLILQFNLDNIVGNWGRAEIRRHNLNTYRGIAQEYQQYCLHFGKIQSVFGFIGYLEKITQTKEFSELENPIGVKVLTYHRSKGLEYPMLIAAGMDNTIKKKNIYQAKVQNEGQTQQLAGRWIRFFVDPLHSNTVKSPYYDAMFPLEDLEQKEEIKEKLRLLYVGLTRPRDYLVFALSTNKTEGLKSDWMTQCFGDDQWLEVLKGLGLQSIDIPIDSEQEPEEEQVLVEENLFIPSVTYLEIGNPISLLLNPSKDKVDVDLRIEAPCSIGQPILKLRALRSNEFSVFGDMIHQVMVSSEMPASFPSLIETYGFAEVVKSAQLETIVNNFDGWTSSQFGKFQAWHEIPFRLTTEENQVLNGIIDLALETEEGWILIDHKTYDGLDFEKKIKDEGYLSQLAYYQLALEKLSNKPVIKTFLHFPMTANVVEISR
jgi:ATP-dependent helicase/nuclease subunit A